MRRVIFLLCALLSWPSLVFALSNSDFEQTVPGLSPTTFVVFPTGAGWTFNSSADGSGLTGKQSGFTSGNPFTSTSGQYVAFIQNHGSFTQNVYLPAGNYVVTLSAAQRMNYQIGTQVLSITVGSTQRGTFTPTTGDLQNYSTAQFNIGTSGTKALTISGVGSGTDYTAFIDNIAISKVTQPAQIAISNDVQTPCNASLAQFNVDFALATHPLQAGIWVRHMDHTRIISSNSWYGASVNTLVSPDSQDCDRGPYAAPTPPNDQYAESTFQLLGKQAGILMLSRDSIDSMNPHTFYGIQLFPSPITFWQNPGDSVEMEVDLRMTMFNPNQVSNSPPVGQYYVAFDAVDPNGKHLEFSILAYDSRNADISITCDHVVGPDGTNAVVETTFASSALGCSAAGYHDGKYIWVPYDSTSKVTLIMGNSGPDHGAWQDLRTFKARLTREGLQAAINEANTKVGGFDPNPSNYTLAAYGVLQEMVWYDSRDQVDMASSLNNLKINKYSAQ